MNTIYIVEARDTDSDWVNVESVHRTREGAEESRKTRQVIWNDGYGERRPRYIVRVRVLVLND